MKQSAKRRYEMFCRAYLLDMNASKAAIAAGYSKNGASVTGSQLLAKPMVQARISELVAKKAQKIDLSSDRILEEIARLGYANMLDYMRVDDDGEFVLDFSKLTREQAAAIQEYTVDATGGTGDGERKLVMRTRFKLADKTRALELLGKYRKLFIERVEVSGLEGLADLLRERRKAVSS